MERIPPTEVGIKALLLAANPRVLNYISVDEEARRIKQQVSYRVSHKAPIDLFTCPAARLIDLIEGINFYRPQIVHFCSHGGQDFT